jgi:uncharacterized protein (UPF0335 family)
MASENDIAELLERFTRIEGEIKLLQEDKKELLAQFKDKIDPKAFKAALQVAKIYGKLKPEEKTDFDAAVSVISKDLALENLE